MIETQRRTTHDDPVESTRDHLLRTMSPETRRRIDPSHEPFTPTICAPAWAVPCDLHGRLRVRAAHTAICVSDMSGPVALLRTEPLRGNYLAVGLEQNQSLEFRVCRILTSANFGLGYVRIELNAGPIAVVEPADVEILLKRAQMMRDELYECCLI